MFKYLISINVLKKLVDYFSKNRKLEKEIMEYDAKKAEMKKKFKVEDYNSIKRIQTAWTIDDMNKAVDDGFKLHIVDYKENPEVFCKVILLKDPVTGKINTSGDYRSIIRGNYKSSPANFKIYPTGKLKTNLPFGAYLLPPNLKLGEIVLIEEIIEELVGGYWNQGDVLRQETCLAIWDGEKFEYNYVKPPTVCNVVG